MAIEHGHRGRIVAGVDGGSVCSSDADGSWHSSCVSNSGSGSCNESRFSCASRSEIGAVLESALSDCCSDEDLESGVLEIKVRPAKAEQECRICQMSLDSANQEYGVPIELGCSCKNDLGAAHLQCAEAWFKIRGNRTCEICGDTAHNVVILSEPEITEQLSETGNNTTAVPSSETGHRLKILNFLLVCMIFAFVVSWLLHFSVPS